MCRRIAQIELTMKLILAGKIEVRLHILIAFIRRLS